MYGIHVHPGPILGGGGALATELLLPDNQIFCRLLVAYWCSRICFVLLGSLLESAMSCFQLWAEPQCLPNSFNDFEE